MTTFGPLIQKMSQLSDTQMEHGKPVRTSSQVARAKSSTAALACPSTTLARSVRSTDSGISPEKSTANARARDRKLFAVAVDSGATLCPSSTWPAASCSSLDWSIAGKIAKEV
jgi:hypothetical protein